MNLATLEKRVRTLETMSTRQRLDKRCSCRSAQQMNYGTASWVGELEELTQEAKLITEQAKTAGDPRTALASIRVRCCIVELAAKLRGDLDERSPTNIVNVNLDSETAKRIAETYLERHKPLEAEPK
jgi:hypothetical protein